MGADKYTYHRLPPSQAALDIASSVEGIEMRRLVGAVVEDNLQRSMQESAAEINAIYAARRAAGLADNDAGMGRLAEAETRNWRK